MEIDLTLAEEFKDLNRDDAEFNRKCVKLAKEISSHQLTIVQLVEQLGPFLVDVSLPNRELGTWILTQVLQELPSNHFDVKQLEFICNFYADRLKDHHQVIPAVLAGILALSKFNNFPDGAATKLLSALFHNVSCQQQQEHDRYNIYKILEVLLAKCTTELCTMGLDYVYGVISAVDGERNPKNLILLFNWFPTFLKTVNLGHLTEEAFEILACYFPVDFKAPSEKSNAITRDQLADSLAPCLTSIPQFAEFCFPLALEKLESSVEIAKLDSLKLLELGCHSFNTDSYVQHSTEIWSQIQKELFNNPTPIIEAACLSTLISVIKKISQDPSINTTVKDIVDTVKRNLLPDSKLFEPSSKLLLCVASGSEISSNIVTQDVVPILINTFNITTTKSQKSQLLKTIVSFFTSYLNLHNDIEFEELKKVPYLCLKGVLDDNDDLRSVGFDSLAQISKILPIDVRQSLYENLRKLLTIPQNEKVKKSIFSCFESLAKYFPEEIKEEICMIQISNELLLTGYLEALCVIADHDFFSATVVDIFLEYLKRDLSFSQVVIITLRKLLEENENNKKIYSALGGKDIIDILVDFSICNEDFLEIKYLECVAFVLKSVIRNLTVDEQVIIVHKQIPKLALLKSKRVFILYGVLCCLKREVEIDYGLLNDLTELLLKEKDPSIKETSAQLVANLINKCSKENIIQNYLSQFSLSNITDVSLLSWVTKALVMRNHEKANEWTNHVLQLLEIDKNVAVCFRVVMNDSFDCLSTKSYCVKTLLYQQKFFTYVSNKLNENYCPGKTSHLVALGYLLEYAPKQVILLQFQKLLKLIVLCLDECGDSDVIIVILQIIKEFIINKEKCIEDQFSDFLTRFLKLSTFDKSMNVRILALQCLQECTSNIPVYKLLMHKQEVVTVLGKVIDDKKRVVRREAVEARSLWFLIDAPM